MTFKRIIICHCSILGDDDVIIKGKIIFPREMGELPEPSCVTLELKELSYSQAFSNVIATHKFYIYENSVYNNALDYKLHSKRPVPEHLGRLYVLTAVVNIGWCREANSIQWIEKGDYITMIHNRIMLNMYQDEYVGYIHVSCYGK